MLFRSDDKGWVDLDRMGKEGISGAGNGMDKGVEDPELDFYNNQSCRRKVPSSPWLVGAPGVSWRSDLPGAFFLGIYLFICLFIYLFLAALGLCCHTRAFSSCGKQGLLFVAVRRLLVVASLVAEHGL